MADPHMLAKSAGSQSESRKLADLRALLEVSRQLGGGDDLLTLLRTIETAALQVLDCERVSIFLHDAENDELYSSVATGQDGIRFPANRGIAGEAFRKQAPVNVPDAYADPRFNPEVDRKTGFRTRSLLTTPLLGIDQQPVGVIQVLNKLGGPFGAWDEELVRSLGAQAGVALQRQMLMSEYLEKQRIQEDLRIAHDIQQRLLPRRAPKMHGYDIAGWNQPTDETGGDVYDFQVLMSNALAVTIADVTGHGVGPALIAAEFRAFLRASLSLTQNLERVLALVNDLLNDDLPDDRFVTAFVGLLEAEEHRFSYISAGQGPLFHFMRSTGEVRELPTSGLPLGVLPGRNYELSRPATMEPGDMLLLITDGFVEWPDPDKHRFGNENVRELLRRHHGLSAVDFIQTLYQEARDFADGEPQQDDLTAVVIRRLG
jgi:phosphoserine phosphatase